MPPPPKELVSVRYIVDDVEAAIDFSITQLGFTPRSSVAPAFADVMRGHLRLLLSGPASSAGCPMPDGSRSEPGGWNRIHLITGGVQAEVRRLRRAGLKFRNDILTGPGSAWVAFDDRAGNPVGLFRPAAPNHAS